MPRSRGFVKAKVVSRVRRTKEQAYGSRESWEAICAQVHQLYNHTCARCKKGRAELRRLGRRLECHHIVPVSRGGKTVIYNLKPLCSYCHGLQPGHSHLD